MKEEKNKKYLLVILVVLLLLGSLSIGYVSNEHFYKYFIQGNRDDKENITELDSSNQLSEDTTIVDTTIVDDETYNKDDNNTIEDGNTNIEDNSNNVSDSNKNSNSDVSNSTNSSGNSSSSNSNSSNSSSSNNSNKNNSSSTGSSYSNSNTGSSSNTDSSNNTDDEELTQEELNNQYRNELQNTYGIKIAYGNDMGSYLVASYIPTKMTDDDMVDEYLGRLENELKKYPSGFFKEMADFGMPLTLYLVKDIPSSGIAGLTDRQFYNNIIVTVQSGTLFEKTLNHELMHYIDAYIETKMYPEEITTSWNALNPDGYEYGSFDTSLDFLTTLNDNSYFLSNYAQTNWREDRATMFEDMMTRTLKRSCYSSGTPLYNKMSLIAEQIDKYYNCVNSSTTEYWERFL